MKKTIVFILIILAVSAGSQTYKLPVRFYKARIDTPYVGIVNRKLFFDRLSVDNYLTNISFGIGCIPSSAYGGANIPSTAYGNLSIWSNAYGPASIPSAAYGPLSIGLGHLSQAVIDRMDAAGGGTINNFPNDTTIVENSSNQLGVKPASLKHKYFTDTFSDSIGVWVRKGIIVTYTLAGEGISVQEPSVIYDANPQILSADSVFKLWYRGQNLPGTNNIFYAESYDGISWTKRSTALANINGLSQPSVFKLNGSYYFTGSDGSLSMYTSTDGITWTHNNGHLYLGTGGTWDDQAIANTHVWIEGGTWYMLYEGCGDTQYIYSIGLATSPDGVTWTKYGSNPVLTQANHQYGGPWLTKIGGTYWLWAHTCHNGNLPTDVDRFYSTDLHTWIQDPATNVYARRTAYEGFGLTPGQIADVYLLEHNDNIYMYYSVTNDQDTGMIALAIAPMPLSQLVNSAEGSLQHLFSESSPIFEDMQLRTRLKIGYPTLISDELLAIRQSGVKTEDSYGGVITNTATSAAGYKDKFGLRIINTGTWDGAEMIDYGLYVDLPGGSHPVGGYVGGKLGIGILDPLYMLDIDSDASAYTRVKRSDSEGFQVSGWGSGLQIDPCSAGGHWYFGRTTALSKIIWASGSHYWGPVENISIDQKYAFWGGDLLMADPADLGVTHLTDGTFTNEPGAGKWSTSGGWDATFSGNKANFIASGGTGNLSQTAANQVGAIGPAQLRYYRFTYIVSNASGSPGARITSDFAEVDFYLTLTSGTHIDYFKSSSNYAGAFTITAYDGDFSLDGLVLEEVIGGDMIVTGVINSGEVKELMKKIHLIDTGEYSLPSNVAGWGKISMGNNTEYATFIFANDATISLVTPGTVGLTSTNVGTANDVDAKLNIYDGGDHIVIENQLGSTLACALEIHYYSP